jgi:hypothetical protein
VSLPCSGAGTRMCQLCKFSPSERVQYIIATKSLYMDSHLGLEYILEKIKRFVKDLVCQVPIFIGRNKLISNVFSLAERTYFLHCCLKRSIFRHHQKFFIFIKAWLFLPWTHSWALQTRSLKRFRLSKPLTDNKTSLLFELLLLCKKLL